MGEHGVTISPLGSIGAHLPFPGPAGEYVPVLSADRSKKGVMDKFGRRPERLQIVPDAIPGGLFHRLEAVQEVQQVPKRKNGTGFTGKPPSALGGN